MTTATSVLDGSPNPAGCPAKSAAPIDAMTAHAMCCQRQCPSTHAMCSQCQSPSTQRPPRSWKLNATASCAAPLQDLGGKTQHLQLQQLRASATSLPSCLVPCLCPCLFAGPLFFRIVFLHASPMPAAFEAADCEKRSPKDLDFQLLVQMHL